VKESYNNFLVKLNFYKENVEDNRLSTCLNINDPNYPILFDYLTGLNGIEANFVSARDFASVNEGKDLIVESGLANMIDKWATGINVILNNQVKQINWGRKQIEIYTKSKKYVCKSVLLTVSNGILANEDIAFIPKLPDYKIQAIHNLPMGILNKIGVLFEEGTFRDNQLGWYVVTPDKYHNNISEIFSFEIRKKEKEHMIFFFGGKKGSDIENYPKKYYKKIIEFIKKQFGNNIEKKIIKLIHSSWGKDPYSKGAYSYALPGHNFERDLLKKPLEKKVYFAGEATINKTYGTCHGAYISGNYAASKIIYDLKN
jgi:monoamine oxidase